MVLMLPRPSDNGARLAALLPTSIAAMAQGAGYDPSRVFSRALRNGGSGNAFAVEVPDRLPSVKSMVLIVIDGLGYSNLKSTTGHARSLASLPTKRIETVIPSTTGAALTTITTGRLPGEHGLIGYRIRHPELGLITTLKDWQGIDDPKSWQRSNPLFALTSDFGARAAVIGRPAHAEGGLTEAILSGAEYHPGQTIGDRLSIASRLLRSAQPVLVYLYVDELDRAAHSDGWISDKWLQRLEQLDGAFEDFMRALPGDVGVLLTADHGMIDVPPEKRLMLDAFTPADAEVEQIGGEPRMRSVYLRTGADAEQQAHAWQQALGKRAWVGTRAQAIDAGWFGQISPTVASRLGDVLVAARGTFAFMLSTDSEAALNMVGQHGGISEEERGVPLALGGALEGTGFAASVAQIATDASYRVH